MRSLLYLLPLAAEKVSSTSLVKVVLDECGTFIGKFVDVGVGIASIFLLIVIFYYLTAILDGGKFQMKMLMPLLLYFLICNFSIVTRPVTAFITRLQYECCNICIESVEDDLNKITENYYKDESHYVLYKDSDGTVTLGKYNDNQSKVTIPKDELSCRTTMDAFLKNQYDGREVSLMNKISFVYNKYKNQFVKTAKKNPGGSLGALGTLQLTPFGGVAAGMIGAMELDNGIHSLGEKLMYGANPGLFPYTSLGVMNRAFNLKTFVLMIFQWACDIVEFMLKMLGAVLIGVLIAFGPITWAFALFPGNGRFIVTWFLRLCQFSLYSPLVCLIKGLGIKLFIMLLSTTVGFGSFLMVFGVLLCIMVALTAVPSISSMIIDGAGSGGVSLSQGIQSISSAGAAVSALILAPGKIGAGVAGLVTGNPGLAAAGFGSAGGFAAGGGKGGNNGSSSGQAGGGRA